MSGSMMRERGLQRVPILDEARRPLGIIYAREALQALLSESENENELLRDYISGSGIGKTEWPSSGSVLSTDACPRQYNEYLKGAAMPRQRIQISPTRLSSANRRYRDGIAKAEPVPHGARARQRTNSSSGNEQCRSGPVARPGHRVGEFADFVARYGIGSTTRTRAQNGGLHLAEAGLCPSSAYHTCRSPHDRPH